MELLQLLLDHPCGVLVLCMGIGYIIGRIYAGY